MAHANYTLGFYMAHANYTVGFYMAHANYTPHFSRVYTKQGQVCTDFI